LKQWFSGQLVAVKTTVQITAGNTTVTYVHNLGYTPFVGIEELDDLGGAYVYVSASNSTQLTITMSSPDPVNVHNFGLILV
jgi:hypothetical protein